VPDDVVGVPTLATNRRGGDARRRRRGPGVDPGKAMPGRAGRRAASSRSSAPTASSLRSGR